MARKSSTTWDTKPHKPIIYGPVARLADWFAGRGDGKAAIPALPVGPAEVIDGQAGRTPYLEIRRRHFLDRSEREHRHMLSDLEPVRHQLAAVRRDIAGSEEKVAELRKRLDSIAPVPAEEVLASRNVVEQHIPDELVRARRQREYDARHAKVQADLEQAAAKLRGLRVEEAQLAGMIITREQILAARIRQLHEHTLRRCGTYTRHLVRKHPDGAALIPFLYLARPGLPDWFQHRTKDAGLPTTLPGHSS
jgi:ABC transport system ATP-binding/permease protein